MKDWIGKSEAEKLKLLRTVANEANLPDFMIEKDWWVTVTLEAIFTCELKESFAFKGGTSLSKSWNILQRFSEDIDIVIGKELFGFNDHDKLGRAQRERMRDAAHLFVMDKVLPLLKGRLLEITVPETTFRLYAEESKSSDQDPTIILLDYNPIVPIVNNYTLPRIQIEIGVRAMMEPTEERPVRSLLSQYLDVNETFPVRTVLPQRTFWEKAFLLHELFQKPIDKIDIRRMSRHWYDLHRLSFAGFDKIAFADEELFKAIRNHRGAFTKVPGVNYETIFANTFNLLPPEKLKEEWNRDYAVMMDGYIYKDAPSITNLTNEIRILNGSLAALAY